MQFKEMFGRNFVYRFFSSSSSCFIITADDGDENDVNKSHKLNLRYTQFATMFGAAEIDVKLPKLRVGHLVLRLHRVIFIVFI